MEQTKNIILFDGECNFCSFWVKYVIKRDKKDAFRFASLQSDIGRKYLNQYQVSKSIDSVVFIQNEKSYVKSTATLYILKAMRGFRVCLFGFIIIPTFIRDFFYDLMAKYRYKLFGTKTCELPLNNDYKNKFLN